jgi:hypothetical protein
MKKIKRKELKIIDILKEKQMNSNGIQQKLNNSQRVTQLSTQEIAQICKASKHIEKKDFTNTTFDGYRCRQVIWGLKE